MNENKKSLSPWLFGIPVLIFLGGVLISILLFSGSGIGTYPTLIADAYREEQHHLNVPGSRDINITRTGAYGIYYEYSLVSSVYPDEGLPPAIDCSLTSESTGTEIAAVPDYVETNRYRSKDLHTGVLIMSITVNQPDSYTFACNYQDGRTGPEISVAIGPNYFWEFIRVAVRIFISSIAGMAILLGSMAIAVVVLTVIIIKRRHSSSLMLFVGLMFVTLSLSGCGLVQPGIGLGSITTGPRCDSSPRGCTIFTVSHDDRVFFGGNGDWVNFDGNYYWVDPGSNTRYGAIYFGVPENVQQGFNEKGLAYDSNGLPQAPVNDHPGRKPVFGNHSSHFIQILQECATVEEVITWVQEHQWHESMHYQMHFADAFGDAVVISAGPDGKLAFTRKPPGDSFLVSTNFNLANPSNTTGGYPCSRYDRAKEMLEEINDQDDLTAERAASVLDAVHVETATNWTVMSVVGDLPRGLVYVYLFHQFDAPIVLNVAEEIANPPTPGPLRALFPPATIRQVDQAYERLTSRSAPCDALSYTWLGLVAISLVALLFLVRPGRRGFALWLMVVVVMGPVGLLLWLIAKKGRRTSVLVEVICDLPPYVVGGGIALLMIIFIAEIGDNDLLQLIACYGLPLTIGLFLYQAPLLARATRSGYGRTLTRCLPTVLVSTNLVIAGFWAVNIPLFKLHMDYCGATNATVILSWWAIVVLSALVGGVLLSAYHVWSVRRGFTPWTALLQTRSKAEVAPTMVTFPTWRQLWLWIGASFIILIAGAVLGSMWITILSGVS